MVIYKEDFIDVVIGDNHWNILQVSNVDEVFDALISSEGEDKDDERIPYWTELWPSAMALSRFIADHPDIVQDKSVIELGSGLGLPSMVAATFTREVLCTDYLQDALTFAEKNALNNGINNIIYQKLDWRNLENYGKYDVVLASDIAYEKRFFEDLPVAFDHLMHKDSTVLLSEPGRALAADFIQGLGSRFHIQTHVLPVEWRGTLFQTSIHVLKKSI
ncbi:MAG: methyltransferase domain-containing protein [Saprospiraceae bacterium]|nr:methyltransferase domain-containing protein [Saprospiraceae bacterium]